MNSPETFFTIDQEQIYGGIIITNPYPPNGAVDVELTPTLIFSVNHLLGKSMDIIWKWNNEGVWEIFGVDNGVYNGTYQKINPNFSKYNTTYQWRVEINDELGNWLNQTYSFTTISENEPPEITITQPESGFLYIHLFGQQLKIVFQPSFVTLIIGKIDINVSVTDNDGVAWVKYYIDDELRETLTQEPYSWTWDEKTIIFPFVLKVTACDYSGNQNSTQMNVWRMQLL
jgi:hypothetical protein